MSTTKKLAIVIPAYKSSFLHDALASIAAQTCKDFTVYIGDDKSPYDLQNIADSFKDVVDVVYKRFDQNWGGGDLVAQWNRCMDMVGNEEWVWFFSDDDMMQSNCVELFYEQLKNHGDEDIFHFNVDVIDSDNKVIEQSAPFPDRIQSYDLFRGKVTGELRSFIVEYIFKASAFKAAGKFQHFDLAWGTDDATWIKLAKAKGIQTITGASVLWRYSGENITSNVQEKKIVDRKFIAITEYLKWAQSFFKDNNIADTLSYFKKIKGIILQLKTTKALTFKEKYAVVANLVKQLGIGTEKYAIYSYLYYSCIKQAVLGK